MDVQSQWSQVLTRLSDSMSSQEIDAWFSSAEPLQIQRDGVVIQVQNRYYVSWITDNYLGLLESCAGDVLGVERVPFELRVPPAEAEAKARAATPTATRAAGAESAGPNPTDRLRKEMTFDNFVVGACNTFAHAAAAAVAEKLAVNYNPLYIYGPTGLGKTHLMHAIGNAVIAQDPTAQVAYITAEDFTNQLIHALRYKRPEDFRRRYRDQATVLLIDDIQFLSGKDSMQEEFFHTFNALMERGRQVVITSDVEPKAIDKLAPRLRTRFEGGLLADMQPPDPETLRAILHQKADQAGIQLQGELVEAIAHATEGSVRELEGMITKLGALSKLYPGELDLDFARRRLPQLFQAPKPAVTTAGIIEAVAKHYNVRSADITGKRRMRTLTVPRHVAMYLARTHLHASFPELGREFGGRDHSTVQHGVRKVTSDLKKDPDLVYTLQMIERALGLRSA